ncbi:MAG: hypothetical protein CM1200mP26_24970 [Acidimicrobiales bacterium]|nr:MAG: hypothetical protein CM1200mP26_24970 [Acidimicrobiales bacterium]
MRPSGVRAINMTSEARWPFVTQNFVPLTTHSSPSRSALQRIAPVSLPASGSDNEKAGPRERPVAHAGQEPLLLFVGPEPGDHGDADLVSVENASQRHVAP